MSFSSVQSFTGLSYKGGDRQDYCADPQKPIKPSPVPHPFLVKEIALQAGLSEATIDRVLNSRGGVRGHTAERVKQAIRELRGQSEQAGLTGRRFAWMSSCRRPIVSPRRCGSRSRMRCQYCGPRSSARATISAKSCALAILQRSSTGSARGERTGSFFKAPDEPEIASAVDRVVARGIPVVTLVTDVPNCRRAAYVGMDNRAAGETAAYLIGEWLGGATAKILATLSSNRFRGEEEREIGFRRALRTRYPDLGIVEASEGLGIDQPTGALVRKALAANPDIVGAYSIGGGNQRGGRGVPRDGADVPRVRRPRSRR